uniref:Ion transport domain-containing protein n=1 Tax=Timema shepardi TaxID=629360 RepID=A0A7R9AXB8_TIMSH|nr:unnamed protein product [Timema shepardi]
MSIPLSVQLAALPAEVSIPLSVQLTVLPAEVSIPLSVQLASLPAEVSITISVQPAALPAEVSITISVQLAALPAEHVLSNHRFDQVGIYVVMFLEILQTLIKVLIVFSILIIAFGLAFYILLSKVEKLATQGDHLSFRNVPMSLMRTFAMMLGEIDFLGTYVQPYYEPEENDKSIPFPIPAFFILGLFMVLMPILLMNLLIGLAVGDIESVRRNAQLKRLAMQVNVGPRSQVLVILWSVCNCRSQVLVILWSVCYCRSQVLVILWSAGDIVEHVCNCRFQVLVILWGVCYCKTQVLVILWSMCVSVVLHTELERKLPQFLLEKVDKQELIEYPNDTKCKLGFLDAVLRKWFCNPFTDDGKLYSTVHNVFIRQLIDTLHESVSFCTACFERGRNMKP